MNVPRLLPRALTIAGLIGMVVGAIDPLEGSFVILPCAAFVATGALIGQSRFRPIIYCSFALLATGIAAMVVLSWMGGFGGDSGRSWWWAILIAPYPIGWLLELISGVLSLGEPIRKTHYYTVTLGKGSSKS